MLNHIIRNKYIQTFILIIVSQAVGIKFTESRINSEPCYL